MFFILEKIQLSILLKKIVAKKKIEKQGQE